VKFSREAKVGLLAVISFVILYFGFNYLKGIEFLSPTKTYYAVYDNVAGMSVSNSVTINGYAVGRVSNIKIMQEMDNQIVVAIDLGSEIVLGDSTIALLTSDFLGTTSIDLKIGDIEKPIEDGDTLIGEIDKGIAELLKESTLSLGDNLSLTIRRVNSILDSLVGVGGDFKTMIKNMTVVSGDVKGIVKENRDEIDSLSTNLNLLSMRLIETVDKTKPILNKFNQMADTLSNLPLNATLNKANQSLEELNTLLSNMNAGEGTVGRLLKDDSLYVNINQAIKDLDALLIHLNTYPKHFFSPLGKSRRKIERDLRKEED